MTEADWLTGTDFTKHVRFAAERLSPRRQRLLAAGFCRAVAHLFAHPDLSAALAVVERYADGLASAAELDKVRLRCRALTQEASTAYSQQIEEGQSGAEQDVQRELAWTVAYAASSPLTAADVARRADSAAVQFRTGSGLLSQAPVPASRAATEEQARVMLGVVRDVVGNPFRVVAFEPAWRTDTVVALARQMYESREFSAMPILADALQDAGCDNADVLNHCRYEGGHLRGCWVLDQVLGKE